MNTHSNISQSSEIMSNFYCFSGHLPEMCSFHNSTAESIATPCSKKKILTPEVLRSFVFERSGPKIRARAESEREGLDSRLLTPEFLRSFVFERQRSMLYQRKRSIFYPPFFTNFAFASPITFANSSKEALCIAETVLKAFINSCCVFGPMPGMSNKAEVREFLLRLLR